MNPIYLLNYKDKYILFPIAVLAVIIIAEAIARGAGALICLLVFWGFLLKRRHLLLTVFTLFILTFSDSRASLFGFAQSIKPIVILILAVSAYVIKENNALFKYFIPFFAIAFLCVFRSETMFMSFQKTLSMFLLIFAIPIMTKHLLKWPHSKFKLIFIVPLAILLSGLIVHFISPEFSTLSERYRGLLGNPNGLGIFISIYFLLFQTIKYIYPNLFTNNEHRILLALFLISLLMSGSRTAMTVVILFYAFNFVFRFQLLYALFLSALLFIIGQYVVNNLTFIIIGLGLEEFLRLDTVAEGSGRTIAWQFAWEKIQENLLIGKGFTYTEYIFGKNSLFLNNLGHQGNAHNSYLTIWLNTGLLGVIAFFTPVLYVLVNSYKRYTVSIPILLCVFFSINMESWLSASLNPFTIIFFMILTLLFTDPNELKAMEEVEIREIKKSEHTND